ncbi:hypothetical protein KKH13_01465, partial [Patescibacteria group bacterium]|nr:hypothetical protein [Patescibacteria group bacterium]
MAGCEFNPTADVAAFAAFKNRLGIANLDWTPEQLQKQALIVFNEEMFPQQVSSYFAELNGETGISTGQSFEVNDGQLVNRHYDFSKMIDHASSEAEKKSMINFQDKGVAAKPGEKILVLDLSAISKGGGVKYLDIYEKESENLVKHKERIDLTGDQPDLTIEQAQEFLIQPEETSAMLPVEQFQSLPEIQLTEPTPILIEQTVEPEKLIPLVTTGFWFGMATAVVASPSVIETPAPVFEMPTGFHPEGTIELAESKPIVKEVPTRTDFVGQPSGMILEAPAVQEPTKIIPLGLDAVEPRVKQETGVVPTRRVLVGQKIVEPVGQKTEKRVERGIEIQTTQPKPKLSAEQTVVFKVTPTRIIPVGPEQIETVIEKSPTL